MCCFAGLGNAQQEALHTQFMYNKTGVNPAAAGSTDSPCLTAIYRKSVDWVGRRTRSAIAQFTGSGAE